MLPNPFARSHIEDYLHGEEPWAVVTGSTDGIGKATASVLLSKGFNVLLHGRNPTKLSSTLEALKELHPTRRVESVLADLSLTSPSSSSSESESSSTPTFSAIPQYITTHNLRVTLFINNAAFVDREPLAFSETPLEEVERMLNVGVVVFTRLCYEMIPLMKEERVGGRSMMVNMGSAAAEYPTPFLSVYAGTKGFMLSFTRILAAESRLTPSISNITFLYIDIHQVTTPKNGFKPTLFSPSADTFAKSLVSTLGKRRNRSRGGAYVLVTPYWGHQLERFLVGLVSKGFVEGLARGRMEGVIRARERRSKPT